MFNILCCFPLKFASLTLMNIFQLWFTIMKMWQDYWLSQNIAYDTSVSNGYVFGFELKNQHHKIIKHIASLNFVYQKKYKKKSPGVQWVHMELITPRVCFEQIMPMTSKSRWGYWQDQVYVTGGLLDNSFCYQWIQPERASCKWATYMIFLQRPFSMNILNNLRKLENNSSNIMLYHITQC